MRTFYFHLWFLLSFFYFFLAYSQPLQSGCLPYFHTWCGLSANLGCRSETCCTARGSLKRQDAKKSPKIRHHRTTLSGHIFPKKLLNSNTSSTCRHDMANFGPVTAKIGLGVWCTPANFNGFRVLAAFLHGTLVLGVSQTAALNRGRHPYSARRPSRWALSHGHCPTF